MKRWLFVVFLIGMMLLGLVLVVKNVDGLVDRLRPPSGSRRADGVVIRVESRCGEVSSTRPVVRFVTAREQVIEFESHVNAPYSVGDSVKVRYDPNNPRHARLDSLRDRVTGGVGNVILLLFGLLFMVGGFVVFRLFGGEVGWWRRPPPPGGDPSARPPRRAARRRRPGTSPR